MPQHLAAVNASAQICKAAVEGAELHSAHLTFIPHKVTPGRYQLSIGTAGSVILLLQTLLPALLNSAEPSQLTLEGGTHNPLAPTFDFFAQAFLPIINRMGPTVTTRLERPGFYPAGGGKLQIHIEPAAKLAALHLDERGAIIAMKAIALIAHLPQHIAERELGVLKRELALSDDQLEITHAVSAKGPGNVVTVSITSQHIVEVLSGFGMRGVKAETVANNVAQSVKRYLRADVPVGEHLADQLLLPLALAGGGSFRTLKPSTHSMTNIHILEQFLPLRISCHENGEDDWTISIAQRGPTTQRALAG